jgi:hypothetical protein
MTRAAIPFALPIFAVAALAAGASWAVLAMPFEEGTLTLIALNLCLGSIAIAGAWVGRGWVRIACIGLLLPAAGGWVVTLWHYDDIDLGIYSDPFLDHLSDQSRPRIARIEEQSGQTEGEQKQGGERQEAVEGQSRAHPRRVVLRPVGIGLGENGPDVSEPRHRSTSAAGRNLSLRTKPEGSPMSLLAFIPRGSNV